MDRYGFMADLVTTAADCIENVDRNCPYNVFVSNGEPPSDCSHIAAYWTGASTTVQSEKCRIVVRENFKVSLSRCCLKNVGEEFDPVAEDADASCFVKDFGDLFDCLVCEAATVLKNYVRTCQDVVVKIASPDHSPSGGCYGGIIDISFIRIHPCCPPPTPGP